MNSKNSKNSHPNRHYLTLLIKWICEEVKKVLIYQSQHLLYTEKNKKLIQQH